MKLRNVFLALATASFACSGGASVNSSVSGTIRGQAQKVNDAQSSPATLSSTSGNLSVAAIVLTSQSGLCANAGASKEAKSSQYFIILLADVNPTSFAFSPPTAPGDYTVWTQTGLPPSKVAIIAALTTDATCKDDVAHDSSGISGTVKLTAVNNGAYKGTFTATMQGTDAQGKPIAGTTDSVSGSFDTPSCASLGVLVSSTRTTTCF
jgi:hypothetical protein